MRWFAVLTLEALERGRLDRTTSRLYQRYVKSADVISVIKAAGWYLARIKGSHHHFRHDVRPGIVTIPHPRKDIPTGTLRSIERQSGCKLL